MLYFLGQLGDSLAAFNVFRYITFRTAGAVMTALFSSGWAGTAGMRPRVAAEAVGVRRTGNPGR